MKLYGIEKLSLVDYDGKIASTLFTGACNFRCGFCHNSPLVTDFNSLPTVSEEEVLSYLKKRLGVLDGVCITGGEPTLLSDLPEFIGKLKDIGYSVKLDTNGTNPKMVKKLVGEKLIDYIAMDIKNDKENYARTIGFKEYDLAPVEESVDFLLSGDFPFEFRTTIIKEFHTAENMENISKWIKGTKKYFMQKFKDGGSCIENGLHEIDNDTAKSFLEIVKKNIPDAKLRGYDIG